MIEMCVAQVKDRKSIRHSKLTLGLTEVIEQLSMANSVQRSCVVDGGRPCLEKIIRA